MNLANSRPHGLNLAKLASTQNKVEEDQAKLEHAWGKLNHYKKEKKKLHNQAVKARAEIARQADIIAKAKENKV